MAASKFKTKGKQHYRQKGSEERLVETFEYRFLKKAVSLVTREAGINFSLKYLRYCLSFDIFGLYRITVTLVLFFP